jgi:hypothetical protein
MAYLLVSLHAEKNAIVVRGILTAVNVTAFLDVTQRSRFMDNGRALCVSKEGSCSQNSSSLFI